MTAPIDAFLAQNANPLKVKIPPALNGFLQITAFIFLAAFSFGGTVNIGGTDILWAIPFILTQILLAVYVWKGWFRKLALIFFMGICLPLYVLKVTDSRVFFPANGRQIISTGDVYMPEDGSYIGESVPARTMPQIQFNRPSYIGHAALLPKGTKFLVTKTNVVRDYGSGFSFQDKDEYHIDFAWGKLTSSYVVPSRISSFFVFGDGTLVSQDKVSQYLFFTASKLMNIAFFIDLFLVLFMLMILPMMGIACGKLLMDVWQKFRNGTGHKW